MINRDDWLSPAAFVARIDSDSQSLNVQRSNMTDTDREAFRQTLADLGHAEATVFGHWALAAYDKVHDPELYAAAAARAEMEAIAQEATRRFAAPGSFRWQRVNDEPFEYAIKQGRFGDEFVKFPDGECVKRSMVDPPNPYIYDKAKRTLLPNPAAGPRQSKET
jgi:hypothetical protein